MSAINPCIPFAPEIAEVALGRSASEALSAHLAQCAACAAELVRQRALVERFEVTLGALAQPEPPDGLVDDVLARVRSREPRGAGRQVQTTLAGRRFATVLAGLAIAASLILFLVRFQAERAGVVPAQTAALTAWRSPTLSLLENHDSVLRSPLGTSRFSIERPSLHS